MKRSNKILWESNFSKSNETNNDKELAPRWSKRARKEINLGFGYYTFLIENDPTTFDEVIKSLDSAFYREAINGYIEF